MALELVARIPTLAEAQIAAGALRAGGFDAEVFDANFGQVESPVIEQLGGFRIMAPAGQAGAAREMLNAIRSQPRPPPEGGPWPAAPSPRTRRLAFMRRVWAILFVLAAALWIAQALGRGF
jgi:hypothetical protein